MYNCSVFFSKSNENTNNNFIYPFLMKLGEGKLEYVEKNQSEQGVACQLCTQSTLVGGYFSHHCTILAMYSEQNIIRYTLVHPQIAHPAC